MSHFDLRVEWMDPPAPEAAFGPERSTWGRLQILLEGEVLTANHPADRPGDDAPFVVGAMSGLADWIVDSWLPIHWEVHTPFPKVLSPRGAAGPARLPSLRDALAGWPELVRESDAVSGDQLGAWQQRHTIGEAGSDLALPSIVLVPEGAWMGIGLDHIPAGLSPTVRFTAPPPETWPAPPVWVPLADVSESLRRFVDDTIERAAADAGTRSWADWLRERWRLAQEQGQTQDAARRWMHGDLVAQQWPAVERRLGDGARVLADLLTDSSLVESSDTLDWLVDEVGAPAPSGRQAGTDGLQVDWGLPAYTQGYRLAQENRRRLGLGDRPLVGKLLDEVLARCGVEAHAVKARGLFRSAVWVKDGGAVLVWADDDARFNAKEPLRFSIAAALGRLLANGPSARNVGAAHGDQARWRPTQLANAFAAEFLLPVQAVRRMRGNVEKLSKEYGISRSAAAWHVANREPVEA